MHAIRERQPLALHRRIAELLAKQPEAVIGKAIDNLYRWTAEVDPAEIPE